MAAEVFYRAMGLQGYRCYDHFKLRLLTLHHAKFTLAV